MTSSPFTRRRRGSLLAAGAILMTALVGCHNGSSSPSPVAAVPPPGPKTSTEVARGEDPPGIAVEILRVTGASGADGSFQVGDRPTVTFTVKKKDGTSWRIDEMSFARMMLSGPTFNYQRVIPEQQDLPTGSVRNADGSFSYTFASGIPAVYAPPINDSSRFGESDGELTGAPLLAGTYTVGLYVGWNYTVDGESFRDADDAITDFLFGGAANLSPREVVLQDNCNQCHVSLRAHGGLRRDVGLCILCHTSGAEDKNVASAANGTPDVTIDFRVMIHRIHNGGHLPSVLGVATRPDGSRDYQATPKPYEIVGFGNRAHDFSHVGFPVWPNASVAMPRDAGYAALPGTERGLEDSIRTGVTSCAACHGDPDGSGPLAAPTQGQLAYSQPSRRACGSCHDDINWSHPYTSNGSTMPPQSTDSTCLLCHTNLGDLLDPFLAHVHPLRDPAFNPGFHTPISAVTEAGTHDNDGTIDPGEKVAITLRLADDQGADVAPSAVSSMSVVLSGPTTNSNIVLTTSVPTAALTGSAPHTILLPENVYLEPVGVATALLGDMFTTGRSPLWDASGAVTSVFVRTGTGGGDSALSAPATTAQNWFDVVNPAGFARNDYLVVDDGVAGKTEYLRIQYVEGNRLWFSSPQTSSHKPGPAVGHLAGATVQEVTLAAQTLNTHYSLNAATGQITELQEFGAGNAVIVTYTTDFVMPSVFPLALNDTPTLDETSGKWSGKPIVDGTYAVTMWGYRNLALNRHGESQNYRATAEGSRAEFLVGSASLLRPYDLISSPSNCYACHQELLFHGGGRRGYDTCIACHGTAGAEDRPQYVAGNAPATPGVTISFRDMLHKIHMGEELHNASSYTVVGFGSGYPNNFSAHSYEHVGFPALPGGVANCTKCHGKDNEAWLVPMTRNHPTAQARPVLAWTAVCSSCHDSDAAVAHIAVQTSASGFESCSVCHGTDREWHVELMHRTR